MPAFICFQEVLSMRLKLASCLLRYGEISG